MEIESIEVKIMKQAVDLDSEERYTEALVFYQEGLQVLDEKTRGENDEHSKNYLKNKIEEYNRRVAAIKELVQKLKEEGNYREQVHIKQDSTGHGYKKLFGRFLDGGVEQVIIEDSYIRTFHQCQNFLYLCELLVKSCDNLRRIQLKTGKDAKSERYQKEWLYNLKTDLQKYGVELIVIYSSSPYFPQIILSSGWIIKISKGLNMYKAPPNRFCLGEYDLDLRHCHDTKLTIVHSKNLKQSLELSHIAAGRQQAARTSGSHRLPSRPRYRVHCGGLRNCEPTQAALRTILGASPITGQQGVATAASIRAPLVCSGRPAGYKYNANMRNPPAPQPATSSIQGQEPLTASMLAAAPLQEQKNMLGKRLFPLIQRMRPDLVGKITGMLLETDNSDLLHMLEHGESLKAKVDEAVAVLQAHQAKLCEPQKD